MNGVAFTLSTGKRASRRDALRVLQRAPRQKRHPLLESTKIDPADLQRQRALEIFAGFEKYSQFWKSS
jgi:hypothetical protein